MSYCRWSSMDFGCDLYCYESDAGFETNVAGRRIVGDVPHVDYAADVRTIKWQYNAQSRFLANCEHEPINLPHAGESFTDGDLESFEMRLRDLRHIGYRFPDAVFTEIWIERAWDRVGELLSEEKLAELVSNRFPGYPAGSLITDKLFKLAQEITACYETEFVKLYMEKCELEMKLDTHARTTAVLDSD